MTQNPFRESVWLRLTLWVCPLHSPTIHKLLSTVQCCEVTSKKSKKSSQTHFFSEVNRELSISFCNTSRYALQIQFFSCLVFVALLLSDIEKKSFNCFIVSIHCYFIQKQSENNDWKCDFWQVRCMFYQVESILKIFALKVPMKYRKNG